MSSMRRMGYEQHGCGLGEAQIGIENGPRARG